MGKVKIKRIIVKDIELLPEEDELLKKYGFDVKRSYTVSDVAEKLGIHERTLRRWAEKGLIKCIDVGKGYSKRILLHQLIEFLQGFSEE